MVSEIHVLTSMQGTKSNGSMVSPVWYNIRRVGPSQYEMSGEHDVDKSWMEEVRGKDAEGNIVGRILPRFAVEQWDRDAYEELITNVAAQEELTRIIIEQIKYFFLPPRVRIRFNLRKHEFDGIVMELAVPQYMEAFISLLADKIHALPREKRLVVVIPPFRPGYPSPEVPTMIPRYFGDTKSSFCSILEFM
jgi:hypothetical protein